MPHTEATPRRWYAKKSSADFLIADEADPRGRTLAVVIGDDAEAADIAALMVRTVNSFDALVEACNEALNYMGRRVPGETQDMLRAALKLADERRDDVRS